MTGHCSPTARFTIKLSVCARSSPRRTGANLSRPQTFADFLTLRRFPLAANDAARSSLFRLAGVLQSFLEENRDSIWAFVLRNLYKPLLLRRKFDALMGNPPWIAFRNTDPDYQTFLKRHITKEYNMEKRGTSYHAHGSRNAVPAPGI